MNQFPADPIGGAWLARAYEIEDLVQLPVVSQVGGRRATEAIDDRRLETYQDIMRPESTIAAHLQFHLRHEVPHVALLSRLFEKTGAAPVQQWVNEEPTGGYARRAAFLYEWLTGDPLSVPQKLGGNYIDALDDSKLVCASPDRVVKESRWRINNNLPGTRGFCPMVVKTPAFSAAAGLDVPKLLGELTEEFGADLLMRAAVWMTLRESKASFAIEGEADKSTRIQRFAEVMAQRTGQGEVPLTDQALADLQRGIIGDTTTVTRFGVRQSPVFVGEVLRYNEVVHYIAPQREDLPAMLEGLRVFLQRTAGQSPVMRSAVASFGFVYIHPLADGNGRVHRFLINDVLRRDGVVPEPMILPVSAVITDDAGERRAYDHVLDLVSAPLMRRVAEHFRFEPTQTTYPDGVVSNFAFDGEQQARPFWRYPDLGPHVAFLSDVVRRTIKEQMREESRYLRSHLQAREALKEIVEMPDNQADRVLRSIEQNRGELSNVLAKEMPVLQRPGIWSSIVEAVSRAHSSEPAPDNRVTERYKPGRPPRP